MEEVIGSIPLGSTKSSFFDMILFVMGARFDMDGRRPAAYGTAQGQHG
jgi:chromosome segregation ATPase